MNILLADDDPDDRLLTSEAMFEVDPAIQLECVEDGHGLLQSLFAHVRQNSLPQLVLLDLNMPRKSGMQALAEIRAMPELQHLPVIVLSTSRSRAEVLECHRRGANAFMSKPDSFQALVAQLSALTGFWFTHCQLPGSPQ